MCEAANEICSCHWRGTIAQLHTVDQSLLYMHAPIIIYVYGGGGGQNFIGLKLGHKTGYLHTEAHAVEQ